MAVYQPMTMTILSKLTVTPTVGMLASTIAVISDTVWLALISAVATLVSTIVLAFIQMRTRKVVDEVVAKVDTAVIRVDEVKQEAKAVAVSAETKTEEIYKKVDGNLSTVTENLKIANERIASMQTLVDKLVEKKTQAIPGEQPALVAQAEAKSEESLTQIEQHTKETAENTAKTQSDVETLKEAQ